MKAVNNSVMIKGNKYGIIVVLSPDEPFEELKRLVEEKFKESSKFFENAKMAISFEGRKLTNEEQKEILDIIGENTEMHIVCVIDNDPETEEKFHKTLDQKLMELSNNTGQFYKGILRSGASLEFETSVVIIGDVNHGARVVSKGNIIVLGSLKGNMDTSTNEGKVKFLDKAVLILDKIDNNVERELYVKKLSDELGVSEQSIYSEIARKQTNSEARAIKQVNENSKFGSNPVRKNKVIKNQEDRLVRLLLMLLATICLDNNVYFYIKDICSWDKFDLNELRDAFDFAAEKIESKAGILAGEILNKLSPKYAESFANIIQSQSVFEDNKKAALDIIRRIDLYNLEARKKEIIELKKSSDLTEGDVELLNRELSSIVSNIAIMKKGL
jgi:hypothetical protein